MTTKGLQNDVFYVGKQSLRVMTKDVDTFVAYIKSIWPKDFPALEEGESEDAVHLEIYLPSGLTCGGFEFGATYWVATVVSGSEVLYANNLNDMRPADFDEMFGLFKQAITAPCLH